ncbi:MAG: molybdopterin-binding protein [Anaerolineales bacterium]|nr:molybdopterin-binding protein [Anaerolineales bacterium]
MKFGPVPLVEAEGKILGHNIAGRDGRRRLRKGKALTATDVAALAALGRQSVYVAALAPEDVDENSAARRVARAVAGPGLKLPGAASGRANALATVLGILRVEAGRLGRLNEHEGLTVASLAGHSPVRPNQIAATVKVIPFALPEATVAAAEAIAAEGGPLLRVDALPTRAASVIFSGAPALRDRLVADFAPLLERLERLGAPVVSLDFVSLDDDAGEAALARTLADRRAAGSEIVVLAGETAIMDRHDIVPRAIERAGGQIEALGAPVDPGNLLMVAYLDGVPVVGAPGCARSRKTNIVDWVLPRLLAGDHLTRADISALGHGGLLEEAPERPMPRDRAS